MVKWYHQAISEAVGVLALVYIGAGAIVMSGTAYADIGLLSIAFAHGLTVAVMVSAVAHISGGHINPAVTVGALLAKRIEPKRAVIYIASQLLGGLVGALLLLWSLPASVAAGTLGTPGLASGVSVGTGILVEAVLTFFLVFVVFGTGIDERNPARIGGLAIGLTVTMDILMGGPLTGAAMNPARWFGPAVVTTTWANLAVYWVGPLAGGLAAGALYGYVLDREPTVGADAEAAGS